MSRQGLAGNNNQVPPGYKQTEVGVIPEDWEVVRLANLAKQPIQNGVFNNPLRKGKGCKLINVVDLYINTPINLNYLDFFDANLKEIKNFGVVKGDIFFTRSSLTSDGIAHCNIYEGREKNVVFDCHLIRFRPNQDLIVPQFFFRYCLTSIARKYFISNSKTTTMTTIDQGVIAKLPIPVPPLPEQKAIASVLSDVDELISSLDKLIAKKRHIKTATMQQLLTGKTRLPGFGEGMGYKKSAKGMGYKKSAIGLGFNGEWKQINLGDITEIISGGTPKTTNLSYWHGNIKWCTPTDITKCKNKYLFETERKISYLGFQNSGAQLLPAGTLLLCSRATIGEVKIAGCEICTNQGFKSIICSDKIDNEFVYYKLLTMKQQMIERAFGSTFLEISKSNVAALELLIPPLPEQKAIASVLSDMDKEIAALEKRRAKTQGIKQGMMQELLTGRTRLIKP